MGGNRWVARRVPRTFVVAAVICASAAAGAAPAHGAVTHPAQANRAAGAGGTPTPVRDWTDVPVSVPVSAIAYDPIRNQVLASVPSTVPDLGNDVVELDPSTGALERSVFVGSDPGPLSVSTDGTTLYVALTDASQIVRVDLSTFTVVSAISTTLFGALVPSQIAVVPGNDNAVVASLTDPCCDPAFVALVAFDKGVARRMSDENTIVDSFVFGPNPSTLYGYDWEVSSLDLSTWKLGANGLKRLSDVDEVITGFARTITYAAPYIYASDGEIVDPSTDAAVTTIPANGEAADPVPAANRVYYVSGSKLEEYRLDTFARVSVKKLAGRETAREAPSQVVSTTVGLAVLDKGGALHLVGPGIGPLTPIPLPKVPNHIHGLVAHVVENLGVQTIAYDNSRHDLLVAIGSSAAQHANDVVEMDPATGAIGRTVAVGDDPGPLALSDDGSTLYVGLQGANSVVEVDMKTFSVVTSFTLGSSTSEGPYFAGAIAVQPGTPTTVAVTRIIPDDSPATHGGVGIFDSGVMRPVVAGADFADTIAFGSDPDTLYAATLMPSGGDQRMAVDAQGAHVVASGGGIHPGFVLGQVGGLLYTSCGVLDATTLALLDSFRICVGGLDVAHDRAYGVDDFARTLTEFQLSTLRTVKTVPVLSPGATRFQPLVTRAGFAELDLEDDAVILLVRS